MTTNEIKCIKRMLANVKEKQQEYKKKKDKILEEHDISKIYVEPYVNQLNEINQLYAALTAAKHTLEIILERLAKEEPS